MNRPKERRRISAAKCADERAKRTDAQQLKLLDSRMGSQTRERARIAKRAAAPAAKPKAK